MNDRLHRFALMVGCCLLTLASTPTRAELDPVIVDGHGMGRMFRIEPMLNFSYLPVTMTPGQGSGWFIGNPGQVEDADRDSATDACPEEEDTAGSNPIFLATGNKVEVETDFVTQGSEMPLFLQRTYNHYWGGLGIFGRHWQSNFDFALSFETSRIEARCYPDQGNFPACDTIPAQPLVLWAHRPDGRRLRFAWNADANAWIEDKADPIARITRGADGTYTLAAEDDTIERYSNIGYILERKNASGVGWNFSYLDYTTPSLHPIYLNRITHTSGRYVQLVWSGGSLAKVIDPAGNAYTYTFHDEHLGTNQDLLASVTTPGPNATTTTYHYEDQRYKAGLTGKSIDGIRYSTFTYDANRRATSSEHAGGVDRHTFSYTGTDDSITRVVAGHPLGRTTTFELEDGRVVSVAGAATPHCLASYRERTYDANGHLDLLVDDRGVVTNHDYNAKGQLLKSVVGQGTPVARTTLYTWDPMKNRVIKIVRPGALQVNYAYDGDGRPIAIAAKNLVSGSPNQNQVRTTTFAYAKHANGMVASVTVDGPAPGTGDAVTSHFNAAGDHTSDVDALGTIATYAGHNALGLPGRRIERNGLQIDYAWDARGRLASTTRVADGASATWSWAYGTDGLPAYDITADGLRTDYTWDAARRLRKIHRDAHGLVMGGAENEERTFAYDDDGNLTEVKDWAAVGHFERVFRCLVPAGAPRSECLEPSWENVWTVKPTVESAAYFDYDEGGRLLARRGNQGQSTRFGRDEVGNVVTVTDALGRITRFAYDPLGRLSSATDALGGVTRMTYDPAGNLASVTDARGLVTGYSSDGFGQAWTVVSPDSGVTRSSWDVAGRRTSLTRAYGGPSASTTTYQYDAQGRLVKATAGGNEQVFLFDSCPNGVGRLCTVTDPSGSVAYEYNDAGQVVAQATRFVDGWTSRFAFAFDASGRKTLAHNLATNVRTTYAYDHGRLASVALGIGGASTAVLTGIEYKPFGPAVAWDLGNGLAASREYDLDGRLVASAVGSSIHALGFGYDAADQMVSLANTANPGMSQGYAYDPLGRLVQATFGNGTSETYALDATGNRKAHGIGGGQRALQVAGASNRLDAVAGNGYNRTFAHDAFGNRIADAGSNGTLTYAYDAFNRIESVTRNAVTTSYQVNALGQRTYKAGAGGNVRTTWSPWGGLLAESRPGKPSTDYVWAAGEVVAMVRNGAIHYLHNDQLGRPEAATNAAKAVVWRANNGPFDRSIAMDAMGGLALGFPGQVFDAETGTWNNGFRDYDASVGRYLQSDPAGLAGGMNSYTYVGGNPIVLVDPFGLCWEWSQSTGSLTHVNDETGVRTLVAVGGYAGHGEGVNAPDMQDQPNVGPIPRGHYTIGPMRDNLTLSGVRLRNSMRLSPAPTNQMHGRAGFLIHGDNSRGDRSASRGCPIIGPDARSQIANSGDDCLEVVR